ncbi:MAG: hypothetical protein U5O39_01965 [Gammaproteobacteria bacterium]|nr:hypothetical protein [Gammaproteobacteria bacterium]
MDPVSAPNYRLDPSSAFVVVSLPPLPLPRAGCEQRQRRHGDQGS